MRSDNPLGFGGVIFFGHHVNERGEKLTREGVQVHVPYKLLTGFKPEPYQFWEVKGTATEVTEKRGPYDVTEIKVVPTELAMTACSGKVIRDILVNSDRFRGLGEDKATKLWIAFRDKLYDILDEGNVAELQKVLSRDMAVRLVDAWSHYANGRFISYLQKYGFPATLARKFLDRHGKMAKEMLEDDPYRLLSYEGNWKKVDHLATKIFGLAPDNPIRLSGAVEEALYSITRRQDTAATPEKIREKLRRLLFVNRNSAETRRLMDAAMSLGKTNGSYLVTPEGLYQTIGPYIMEATVANRIAGFVSENDPQLSLLLAGTTVARIDAMIDEYEAESDVTLTQEQRAAVQMGVTERFSVITGGAGTGKTTVLKALYYVLAKVGYGVVQMALAGKAAKRMREATGKESHTIAGFLNKADKIISERSTHTYYVIDEASMLDLKTTYRIFQTLPDYVRIVLVGDPYQLPPIGAGLVFQKLVVTPSVPKVSLTEVKRQDGSTGIPSFAAAIRKGKWPTEGVPGVRIEQCDSVKIMSKVLELYMQDKERTQIICAVRNNGMSGVHSVNDACQRATNASGRPIRIRDINGNLAATKFREGDRIIFTRNDWEREVMNGSMGSVGEALDAPPSFEEGEAPIIGMALIDDLEVQILLTDVCGDPILDHGYAVTCHKAQGSQFPRVIVPVHRQVNTCGNLKSRILDLTWVYTALTRAECEVIFVGCEETIRKAVESGPRWHQRVVGFDGRLRDAM
jgi:exodeoxyribonuclease V alpha subunit